MMRIRFRSILSLAFMLSVSAGPVAASTLPGAAIAETDRQLREGLFTGAAIGRVGGGEAYLGRQGAEPTDRAVSGATRFDIASVTKTITAAVCASFHAEGKLDPDRPFTDYLPEHVLAKESCRITVRDLAVHASGFAYYGKRRYSPDPKVNGGKTGYLEDIRSFRPTLPYGKFYYSCYNYVLLGLIAERLGGRPLDVLARERIFKPLGMTHTGWWPLADDGTVVRTPIVQEDGLHRRVGEVCDPPAFYAGMPVGNAGVFSTLGDMLRFTEDLLTRRTFPAKYYELLETPTFDRDGERRSFGFDMGSKWRPAGFSQRAFFHSGFTGHTIAVDPENDFAGAVLTVRGGDWQKAFEGRTRILSRLAPPLQILEPKEGAVVPTLTEPQKAYVRMPLAERRAKFARADFRTKEMGLPAEVVNGVRRQTWWPKTTKLHWKAAGNVGCDVRVVDRADGRVVFEAKGVTNSVHVDNLKIASTYDWSVTCRGETAKASFATEALAPRLVRFPGRVPNVRDLGGRIGLDGRRVRQGLVFRSAGLNDNASKDFYTEAEARERGLAFTPDTTTVVKVQKRLEQLQAWRKDPTGLDADREYKSWCDRHPGDKPAAFLKSRIKRAQGQLKAPRRTNLVRQRRPGVFRMTAEEQRETARRFGIRSDIDLRSDDECWGMTGSPLGPSVTWYHYSSSAYAGMQTPHGRAAFAKVFRVFLDERNYPIDFHCIAGQDRTGAVSCILLALLGVEENELYLDWEVTGFWNRGSMFCHKNNFDHLLSGFRKSHPAPTVRESVVLYVKSLGFTDADIAKFRSIMLE